VLPENYLKEVYRHVRDAGGVCIADEVQTGFGRAGSHFWAFETQGVVPDIVTLGKPIGNGHPMAVVVTTPEIARSFANGMEYFATFGGNPVSCAVGLAVLDEIERRGLIANARAQGDCLLGGFRRLQERWPQIGDVRGEGLFLGLDLVKDRRTKEHDGETAGRIAFRARDLGVLIGTDGPYDNVLKMRPPMTFTRGHAELLLETLAEAFKDVCG
jgi:4-aminobutyrate aminotransferase-like enzyme